MVCRSVSCRVCGKQKEVLRTAGHWQSSQSSSPEQCLPRGWHLLAQLESQEWPLVRTFPLLPTGGSPVCKHPRSVSSSLCSCSLFYRTLRGPEARPHPVSCPLQPIPHVLSVRSQLSPFPKPAGLPLHLPIRLGTATPRSHPQLPSPSLTQPSAPRVHRACPHLGLCWLPLSLFLPNRSNNIFSQNSQPPPLLSHHLLCYSWNSIS